MDFTTVEKNLKERGFKVSAFATAQEAADYLNAQIDRSSVSFGGSVTLSQMGLFESLGAHNTIYSHWNVPDGMNADEVREKAATCEHYLLSANGLAETGEIINIDGTGNAWRRRSSATKRYGTSSAATSLRRPMTRRSGAPATSPRRRTPSASA
mgnify:CR=1 FL=1